jgi:hypothetical protein
LAAIPCPRGLKAPQPFFLLRYSADVDGRAPEAVTSLQDEHEHFLQLSLIGRVDLMSWNGCVYAPTASIAPRN